jgi:hypothetical protein
VDVHGCGYGDHLQLLVYGGSCRCCSGGPEESSAMSTSCRCVPMSYPMIFPCVP